MSCVRTAALRVRRSARPDGPLSRAPVPHPLYGHSDPFDAESLLPRQLRVGPGAGLIYFTYEHTRLTPPQREHRFALHPGTLPQSFQSLHEQDLEMVRCRDA